MLFVLTITTTVLCWCVFIEHAMYNIFIDYLLLHNTCNYFVHSHFNLCTLCIVFPNMLLTTLYQSTRAEGCLLSPVAFPLSGERGGMEMRGLIEP